MIRVEEATVQVRPYIKAGVRKGWEADIRVQPSGAARAKLMQIGKRGQLRWRKKTPCSTRSAAERWGRRTAADLIEDLNAKLAGEDPANKEVPTLKEFIPRCIEEHAKANRCADNTITMWEGISRLFLVPLLGDLRLDQIGAAEVQKLKSALADRSVIYTNTILEKLRMTLSLAVAWKVIPSMPKVKKLRAPDKPPKFYTADQLDALIDAGWKIHPRFPGAIMVVLLGCLGGLRSGEMRALRWDDIDFERGTFTVERQRAGKDKLTETKGKKVRTLPLAEPLAAALRQHQHDGPFVLRSERREWASPATIARWLAETAELAGVPMYGLHALRHSFGTQTANQPETSLRTVQAMLGHASMRMTERYVHLLPEAPKAAIDRLGQRVGRRNRGDGGDNVISLQ